MGQSMLLSSCRTVVIVCVCRQVHSALVLSLWSVIYTKTWARLLSLLGAKGGCRLCLQTRSCPIASTPEAGAAPHCLTPTLIPTGLEFHVALRLRGGRGWPVCPEHLGCCWATSLTWGQAERAMSSASYQGFPRHSNNESQFAILRTRFDQTQG